MKWVEKRRKVGSIHTLAMSKDSLSGDAQILRPDAMKCDTEDAVCLEELFRVTTIPTPEKWVGWRNKLEG